MRRAVVYAEISGDHIVVRSDAGIRDKDRIKSIPGARWVDGNWIVPISWGACVTLRGVFGIELVLGDALTAWGWDTKRRMDSADSLRIATDAPGDSRLRPYQRAAVLWGTTVRRGLLADDMGLGKTLEVLSIVKSIADSGDAPFPVLVVCRNSLLMNWRSEIERWFPSWRVGVVTGTAKDRVRELSAPRHVYVISYDTVPLHSKLEYFHGGPPTRRCHVCDSSLQGDVYRGEERSADKVWPQARCEYCPKELNGGRIKTVIADEAHSIKNPHSKQTRAVWALGAEAEFRFGLTGTPIDKSVVDLWSILHFIEPNTFPTKGKFVDRYCDMGINEYGFTKVLGFNINTKDELEKFLNPLIRRMSKEAVAPELPPKIYTRRLASLSTPQKKAYQSLLKKMLAEIDGGVLVSTDPLGEMMRLTQLGLASLSINDDNSVTMTEPSGVLDEMMTTLEDLGDEPVVVMSKSRQLLELARTRLLKAKISYSVVVGGQDPGTRHGQVQRFQDGYTRVCLCSQQVAKEGLNLTRAGTLIFISRSFSNIENHQAEDRVHRIGSEQHSSINIIIIESDTPTTARLNELLYEKELSLQEILKDKDLVRSIFK
jgi:SNF2 family DNA or RNA helicase